MDITSFAIGYQKGRNEGGGGISQEDALFIAHYNWMLNGLVGKISINGHILENTGTKPDGQNCQVSELIYYLPEPHNGLYRLLSKSSTNYGKSAISEDGHHYQAFYQARTDVTSYPLFTTPNDGKARLIAVQWYGGNRTEKQVYNNFKLVLNTPTGETVTCTLSYAATIGAIDSAIFVDGHNNGSSTFNDMFNILTGKTINGLYYSSGEIAFVLNAGYSLANVQFDSSYTTDSSYGDGVCFNWWDDTLFTIQKIA